MMRNRPRVPAMSTGSGLLGEGPGVSSGMKRMMAGVGGGLLGNAPKQQPRSLLNTQSLGRGMRDQQNVRGGLLAARPDFGERQSYNQQAYSHGGAMEERTDTGYYDEQGRGYTEQQPSFQQDYGNQDDRVYDRDMYRQELYDNQDQDYGFNKRGTGSYESSNNQRGLLDEPPLRRGLMEQPRSLLEEPVTRTRQMERYDSRGLLEKPEMGLLGMHSEQRGVFEQPREQQSCITIQYDHQHGLLDKPRDQHVLDSHRGQHGLLDKPREQRVLEPHRGQHGLLGAPREHGFVDKGWDRHGMDIEMEHHDLHDNARDQLGLLEAPHHMELVEPPKPPRALMEMKQEPRSLLSTPMEPRSLMDTGREPRSTGRESRNIGRESRNTGRESRSLMDMNQRGLMDRPREERGPGNQKGLLDFPREQRGKPRQRKDLNQQNMKQSDLMEKADLQMKLLQQQEKIREMEELELLKQQQQAVLLQRQQQHLQQIQQQQQFEQQMQIKQQMQQAELMMNAGKNQSRSGGIPSLLDVPTRGKSTLGKRQIVASRGADNKRARTGPAARRDRRPLRRDRKNSSRDRLGGRRQDRDRRGRTNSRHDSPDRKKRDRKDSGQRSKNTTPSKDRLDKGKDSRNEKGKERIEKDKAKEKNKSKTEETELEQYDPAEPTEDVVVNVVVKTEDKKEDSATVDQMEVGETEEKVENKDAKEDEKDGQKDEEKDEKQKHPEISLTVTVNKKGRSVNDVDKKDVKKRNLGKMYKCNVCTVECYDEESFARHMNGKKHSEKMKILMSSTSQQAILIKSRLQAEEHLRQIEGSKQAKHSTSSTLGPVGSAGSKGKALETHCKVCDKKFTGAYKDHKETPEHKAREDRSKAGCKVCNVSTFSTYQDYVKHLQSNWHLKKMKQDSWPECKLCSQRFKSPRKFVQHCKTDHHIQNKKRLPNEDDEDELGDLVTLDTIGYEEDAVSVNTDQESKEKDMETDSSVFLKPLSVDTNEQKTSTPKAKSMKVEAGTPGKPEGEEVDVPEAYDPSFTVGQKYVVAVSGFFCKLCHKFYNNETAAKVTHCQSQQHYEKLKTALAAKRAKTEEMEKKMEVKQSSSGAQSVDAITESSLKNGNQSVESAVIEEPSQNENTDELKDSSINEGENSKDSQNLTEGDDTVGEEGHTTVTELEESQGVQEEEVEQKSSGVKQQRARRGGGTARTRRGRK